MSKYGYIGKDGPTQAITANSGVFSVNEHKDLLDQDKILNWGQFELIQTQTISSAVAGVDFTSLGDYDVHFLTTHSFSSASDYGALSLRVSTDGGSSFISSGYQYANLYNNAGSNGEQRSTSATYITQMTPPNSGAAPYASNGYAYLYNFLDSTKYSAVTWGSAAVISANGLYEGYNGGGVYPTAGKHDAFRLLTQNASNADVGTISLYGIKAY